METTIEGSRSKPFCHSLDKYKQAIGRIFEAEILTHRGYIGDILG